MKIKSIRLLLLSTAAVLLVACGGGAEPDIETTAVPRVGAELTPTNESPKPKPTTPAGGNTRLPVGTETAPADTSFAGSNDESASGSSRTNSNSTAATTPDPTPSPPVTPVDTPEYLLAAQPFAIDQGVPLYPLETRGTCYTTRGFDIVGDLLVVEFTYHCAPLAGVEGDAGIEGSRRGIPKFKNGDVGLDSWQLPTIVEPELRLVDRIKLGTIGASGVEGVFDEYTNAQSPQIKIVGSSIIRNSGFDYQTIEFDTDTGLFGRADLGNSPFLWKVPTPKQSAPLVSSFSHGAQTIASVSLLGMLTNEEFIALRNEERISDETVTYWNSYGQRLLVSFQQPSDPFLLHAVDRNGWSNPFTPIASTIAGNLPDLFPADEDGNRIFQNWFSAAMAAISKKSTLFTLGTPVYGTLNGQSATSYFDHETREIHVQTVELDRRDVIDSWLGVDVQSRVLSETARDLTLREISDLVANDATVRETMSERFDAVYNHVSARLDSPLGEFLAGSAESREPLGYGQMQRSFGEQLLNQIREQVHQILMAPENQTELSALKDIIARTMVDAVLNPAFVDGDTLEMNLKEMFDDRRVGTADEILQQTFLDRIVAPFLTEATHLDTTLRDFVTTQTAGNSEFTSSWDSISETYEAVEVLIEREEPHEWALGHFDIGLLQPLVQPLLDELVFEVTDIRRPAGTCAEFPASSLSYMEMLLGAGGVDLDFDNPLAIEVLKAAEYETRENYSFRQRKRAIIDGIENLEDRMSHHIASRLDHLMSDGVTAWETRDHLVDAYASTLTVEQWLIDGFEARMRETLETEHSEWFDRPLQELIEDPFATPSLTQALAGVRVSELIRDMSVGTAFRENLNSLYESPVVLARWLDANHLIHGSRGAKTTTKEAFESYVFDSARYQEEMTSFITGALEPYFKGWLYPAHFQLLVSDSFKAKERSDCISMWINYLRDTTALLGITSLDPLSLLDHTEPMLHEKAYDAMVAGMLLEVLSGMEQARTATYGKMVEHNFGQIVRPISGIHKTRYDGSIPPVATDFITSTRSYIANASLVQHGPLNVDEVLGAGFDSVEVLFDTDKIVLVGFGDFDSEEDETRSEVRVSVFVQEASGDRSSRRIALPLLSGRGQIGTSSARTQATVFDGQVLLTGSIGLDPLITTVNLDSGVVRQRLVEDPDGLGYRVRKAMWGPAKRFLVTSTRDDRFKEPLSPQVYLDNTRLSGWERLDNGMVYIHRRY